MRLLIIIAALFFGQTSSSQEQQLLFINLGKPVTLGLDTFYSQKIHEVLLNPNKTFEFWSRPHISCFTWHDYKGTWEKINDTLVFSDQYEIKEVDTKARYNNDSRQSFFISFETDRHSALNNKKIKVQYVYDFDAELQEKELQVDIESDNTIEIPYKDIPSFDKLSSLRIEYILDSGETRYVYLTQNNPVNSKKSDVPNIINVEFVEHPRKEIVYRTVKGVIKNDTLIIVSIATSTTVLPDYYPKLEFENNFVLRK